MLPPKPLICESTLNWDCRHYLGDRPCQFNRLCDGCDHYQPFEQRICIIKLGALGDVIRTLCILPELRRRYPNAHITWVTKPNGRRMLEQHPMIDRLMVFDAMTCMQLPQEQFDLLICLDKEAEPCALANQINASDKRGVGLSPAATPVPFNASAVAYFHLGLSDELKFHQNRKSYAELVYEALGWVYRGQRYELPVDTTVVEQVQGQLAAVGWKPYRPTLGVNVGAGRVFANKMWPAQRTLRLLETFHAQHPDVQVLLLGGPDEKPAMDLIHNALPWTIHTGSQNSEQQFIALIDQCRALFTGDTMAMHVAIARQKQVVVFFGPTCEQEIDLFGRGEKLIAHVPCGPCYKRQCDQQDQCLHDVSITDALVALGRVLEPVAENENITPREVHLPVLRVA